MLDSTHWKPVPGLEFLEANPLGQVRRLDRPTSGGFRKATKGGICSQSLHTNGYMAISIMENGVRKRHLVHRLIATTFVGGQFDGATVDHIDGNRTNNAAVNLRWLSRAENTRMQNVAGRGVPKGEQHPGSKLLDEDIPKLFAARAAGMSLAAVGAMFGVSGSLVHKVTSGTRRRAV